VHNKTYQHMLSSQCFLCRNSISRLPAAAAAAAICAWPGLLSRGDAGIFMRFPPPTYREKIWDHCAGFVIVEEAGGKVRSNVCVVLA
jgi:3'-phosphoadenosine 5'-phosphosulfate (PAPS) 3'-phosphatase